MFLMFVASRYETVSEVQHVFGDRPILLVCFCGLRVTRQTQKSDIPLLFKSIR
jgi:hypothetical protein